MRLILVRHGETLWNETQRCQGFSDITLSPRGREQAQLLALTLKQEPVQAIYSSPLKRAYETAQIIARMLQATSSRTLPVKADDQLKELNQGQLEGLTSQELLTYYPDLMREWAHRPATLVLPGGESLVQLQERAWRAIERIYKAHAGQTVVVVAHKFTNLTIICKAIQLELSNFRRLGQNLAAKTILEFGEMGPVLTCLNDTHHLKIGEREKTRGES